MRCFHYWKCLYSQVLQFYPGFLVVTIYKIILRFNNEIELLMLLVRKQILKKIKKKQKITCERNQSCVCWGGGGNGKFKIVI